MNSILLAKLLLFFEICRKKDFLSNFLSLQGVSLVAADDIKYAVSEEFAGTVMNGGFDILDAFVQILTIHHI